MKLSAEDHAEMVQHVIEFSLTTRQVKEICEQGLVEEPEAEEPIPSHTIRFAKLILKDLDKQSPEILARTLVEAESGNITLARARLQSLVKSAQRAEEFLEE